MRRIVVRPGEIQALGGERRRGGVAILRHQHFAQPTGRTSALPHGHQAAHDVAHHVVQEGHAVEVEAPVHTAPLDRDAVEALDGTRRLARRAAKGGEVMLTHQVRRGGAHRGGVERAKAPADHPGLERRPHRRLEQQVDVASAARAVARMEGRRYRAAPLQRDVGRQETVGAAHPGKRLARHRRVDVHHLVEPMYAAVGAAGAMRRHRHVGERRQSLLEPVLHRLAVGLALPAVVGDAAVGDAQREPRPGRSRGRVAGGGCQSQARPSSRL